MDTTCTTTAPLSRDRMVEIDTRINEMSHAVGTLRLECDRLISRMYRHQGIQRVRDEHGRMVWPMPEETILALSATHTPAVYAEWRSVRDEIDALMAEILDLNGIHTEHRWSRFYLVTNLDGHIHSSTACSTCHLTTEFAWLTDLSGLTEAEAVEAHGAILCSVCYPTAPVEWTNGESHAKKAKREEIDARKAERLAKKIEKALLPNAEPLVLIGDEHVNGRGMIVNGRYTIETLAQAQTWLRDICDLRAEARYGLWSNGQTTDEIITRMRGGRECWTHENEAIVIEAIAAKTGTTPETVAAEAAMKAEKKAKKNR